jgi:hypothetical protein
MTRKGSTPPATFCIIPLFGAAKAEVVLEAWPRISQARFDAFCKRAPPSDSWQAPWTDAKKGALYTQKSRKPALAILRLAIRLGFWPQTFRHLVMKTGGGQARL